MSIHIIQQPIYFSSMILRKCRLFINNKKELFKYKYNK